MNTGTKITIGVIGAVVLVSATTIYSRVQKLKKITASLARISVDRKSSLSRLKISGEIKLLNPSPTKVVISGYEAGLYVSSNEQKTKLASVSGKKNKIIIPAMVGNIEGSVLIPFSAEVDTKRLAVDVGVTAINAILGGGINVFVSGVISASVLGITVKNYTFETELTKI